MSVEIVNTMRETADLEKFLKNLGLEESDQKVYIALLKLADAPVSRIAKQAETKRTTTYNILENLIETGLASSYREKGMKRFVAESPSKLKDMLEGKIAALEKYLPQLQAFYNLAKSKAAIRVFEGEEGAKQVGEEALNCKEKIIYSIGSVENVKEALGASIRFAKRRAAKGIFSKNLRIKGEKFASDYLKKQKEELREVRFLPEGVDIPVMILIFDNKVGVIASGEEGFSFIVESEDFFSSMKSIFELLWAIAEKPTLG